MSSSLEDNFSDVLGKAQRGLNLTTADLAARTGATARQIESVLDGHFDRGVLEKLAPALGLNPAALAGLPQYEPEPVTVDGLAAFSTPFGGITVNAYLVWDTQSKRAAAFDTGADCGAMLKFLKHRALILDSIFLTHAHRDHIADLARLRSETGARAHISSREALDAAEPFEEGTEFHCGALRIETRLTWGHSRGGTTYVVHGLARPVAVVGDAMFAGSMGGGMVSYGDALRTNQEKILTLPPETVLCPGHGPMTTVAAERQNNPFFA